MKRILSVLITCCTAGCFSMFEGTETLMGKFKTKDGSAINVIDAGTGVTSSDFIWIDKIDG